MDNEFWKHVVRNRADAFGQTMQNRLPDFYVSIGGSKTRCRQDRQMEKRLRRLQLCQDTCAPSERTVRGNFTFSRSANLLTSFTLACSSQAESVTSLSSYRQWLRDQYAFKRKVQHGVEEAQREEQRRSGRSTL